MGLGLRQNIFPFRALINLTDANLSTLLQVMVVRPIDHAEYVEPYTRGGARPEQNSKK